MGPLAYSKVAPKRSFQKGFAYFPVWKTGQGLASGGNRPSGKPSALEAGDAKAAELWFAKMEEDNFQMMPRWH